MKQVCVYLATGFEEIEAVSIIDVLRRATIPVTIVSITGNLEVEGAHQIKITADILIEDIKHESIKMMILPGGMPGSNNLRDHQRLGKQILNLHKNGQPLGAICAAPIVFGKLGILKGVKATCYPGFENQLIGAKLTDKPVVLYGNIVTGKGAGVAIHFALKIVEMLKGENLAHELKEKMIVE